MKRQENIPEQGLSLVEKYMETKGQLDDQIEYSSNLERDVQALKARWEETVEAEVQRRLKEREPEYVEKVKAGFADQSKALDDREKSLDAREDSLNAAKLSFSALMEESRSKMLAEADSYMKEKFGKFKIKIHTALYELASTLLAQVKDSPQETEQHIIAYHEAVAKAEDAALEELEKRIGDKNKKFQSKDAQLAKTLRMVFGQKLEKWNPGDAEKYDFDYDNLPTSDTLTEQDKKEAAEARAKLKSYYEKLHVQRLAMELEGKTGHGRHKAEDYSKLPLLKKAKDIYPAGYEGHEDEFEEIGVDTYFIVVPNSIRYYRQEIKSHICVRKDDPERKPQEGAREETLFLKSHCSAELLAYIIILKFMFHNPLYRIEKMFNKEGLPLNRSTMSEWLFRCAFPPPEDDKRTVHWTSYLRDLYEVYAADFMSKCLYMAGDGSPMPIINNLKHKTVNYEMICLRDILTDLPYFAVMPNGKRTKEGVKAIIGDWHGRAFMCDAFQGYDWLRKERGIALCRCTVHARRDMEFAYKADPKNASEGMRIYQFLFAIEDMIKRKGLTGEEKTDMRRKMARPLWKVLLAWATIHRASATVGSPLYKACGYIINHYEDLTAYIDIPEMPMHNNDTEREIRQMVMGKQNYLFCENELGCELAAIMYTFIGACKKLGKDPEKWLAYVIEHIGSCPKDKLCTLLPQYCKAI